jgi:tRNA threonylcarbamoyladenosine biosynthesis protein TsaE
VPLAHVDLYRLEHERELEHIGLDDLYRGDAVVAVEWFDRFPTYAPPEYLELRITRVPGRDDVRRVEAVAHGRMGARLAALIAQDAPAALARVAPAASEQGA